MVKKKNFFLNFEIKDQEESRALVINTRIEGIYKWYSFKSTIIICISSLLESLNICSLVYIFVIKTYYLWVNDVLTKVWKIMKQNKSNISTLSVRTNLVESMVCCHTWPRLLTQAICYVINVDLQTFLFVFFVFQNDSWKLTPEWKCLAALNRFLFACVRRK